MTEPGTDDLIEAEASINWNLLHDLHDKPHPLLNISDDFEAQIRCTPLAWTGEVFQAARTAHHLLDLAKIPRGKVYASDLDARTYLAVQQLLDIGVRLDRIKTCHSRETFQGGMVGDYCNECANTWPCDTYRIADGTYQDDDEADPS